MNKELSRPPHQHLKETIRAALIMQFPWMDEFFLALC